MKISDERLRNTRAWAAARVGSLSGADVIVGAIDELLDFRAKAVPCKTCGDDTCDGRHLDLR